MGIMELSRVFVGGRSLQTTVGCSKSYAHLARQTQGPGLVLEFDEPWETPCVESLHTWSFPTYKLPMSPLETQEVCTVCCRRNTGTVAAVAHSHSGQIGKRSNPSGNVSSEVVA